MKIKCNICNTIIKEGNPSYQYFCYTCKKQISDKDTTILNLKEQHVNPDVRISHLRRSLIQAKNTFQIERIIHEIEILEKEIGNSFELKMIKKDVTKALSYHERNECMNTIPHLPENSIEKSVADKKEITGWRIIKYTFYLILFITLSLFTYYKIIKIWF